MIWMASATGFSPVQRVRLHSWALDQLGKFLHYKAQRAGVPLVQVDPQYTSQQCSWCGQTDRANRPNQALFRCAAAVSLHMQTGTHRARSPTGDERAGLQSISQTRERGVTVSKRYLQTASYRVWYLTIKHLQGME